MFSLTRKIIYLLPLMLFIALGLYFWKGLGLDPRALPSTLIGQPAPAFRGSSLENQQRIITEQIFKGKVSLFHVWATWCTVCNAEQPFLAQLAKQQGLQLVSLNYKDNREQALQWLKANNPYAATVSDVTGNIAINWGVYGTPETFVIDKQGIVRYKYSGMLTPAIWQQQILPLVAKLQ